MSLVVTGATGHLGRLTVEALLARGTDPATILATGRNPEKLAELAALGVRTRSLDLSDAGAVTEAFAGAQRVLLVSGTEFGQRVAQHANAIAAAAAAGVELLAYTSAPYADTTKLLIAVEHRGTEEVLASSAVPHAILRNSWYVENYTGQLATAFEHGALVGSAGEGRVSVAPRRDYAEAAAVVLTTDGHVGQTYELGGDEAVTLAEVAAAISAASGREITYQDLSPADHLALLTGAGVPEQVAPILVDADRAIRDGELRVGSGDLARLIGRPTTPPGRRGGRRCRCVPGVDQRLTPSGGADAVAPRPVVRCPVGRHAPGPPRSVERGRRHRRPGSTARVRPSVGAAAGQRGPGRTVSEAGGGTRRRPRSGR